MAIGFRKSMFGFNRDDVMQYIEESHKSAANKQAEFENKISSLEKSLESTRNELSEVNSEKFRIEQQLKEYNDKYEEIERLSQNIGKLYLVAQSNARSIMKNSAENCDIIRREVENNLESIDGTHTSLDEIKSKMLETSSEFVARLDELMSSLELARTKIGESDNENENSLGEFEALYSELTK